MFKQFSFANEISHFMEKTLVSNQVENTHGLNKLAKAVDYLNDAAAIFERAGMLEETALITEVLQGLAKDLK